MLWCFLQRSSVLISVGSRYGSGAHLPFKHFLNNNSEQLAKYLVEAWLLSQLSLHDDSTLRRFSPASSRCDVTSAVGFIAQFKIQPNFLLPHPPFFFFWSSSELCCVHMVRLLPHWLSAWGVLSAWNWPRSPLMWSRGFYEPQWELVCLSGLDRQAGAQRHPLKSKASFPLPL